MGGKCKGARERRKARRGEHRGKRQVETKDMSSLV